MTTHQPQLDQTVENGKHRDMEEEMKMTRQRKLNYSFNYFYVLFSLISYSKRVILASSPSNIGFHKRTNSASSDALTSFSGLRPMKVLGFEKDKMSIENLY